MRSRRRRRARLARCRAGLFGAAEHTRCCFKERRCLDIDEEEDRSVRGLQPQELAEDPEG